MLKSIFCFSSMNLSELKKLIAQGESEKLEFKEWQKTISLFGQAKIAKRRCLLGYCVAIGNEGGGKLLIGVNNAGKIVGTKAELNVNKVAAKIFQATGQKIVIDEVLDQAKRVLVVQIPARPAGKFFKFAEVPLMRVGESLEVMTAAEQRKILLEDQVDFSAQVCPNSSLADVDPKALKELRKLYQEKHPADQTFATLSDEQFLTKFSLLRSGELTNAGVILLAKKVFLDSVYRDKTEICFEYRNQVGNLAANERKDYREPFVLVIAEIWDKILSRQQVHSFIDGPYRTDIPAFDAEVFREAFFNAVCHRDYTQKGPIFIKQAPEEIEIANPGGFPNGVNAQNIISVPSTPRNSLLAEVFQKILPGVERSGQGAAKIFRHTITQGKGLPSYAKSTNYHVILTLPAVLQDKNFFKYFAKVKQQKQNYNLSVPDLLLLEKIRAGQKAGLNLKTVGHLLAEGLIELYGKTRGAKYILARKYYVETKKLGARTRRIGLSRAKCKELILEHIRKNKAGRMLEFQQIFPELKRMDLSNLLTELKKAQKIKKIGSTRCAKWIII